MKKIITAAILAASLMLTACGQTAVPGTIKVENTEKQVITVTSKESVKVVPDTAQIIFAVNTQAEDAKSCEAKNKEELNKVLEVLTKSGIDEKSIQTSGYGLNPIRDWNNNNTITGYEMTTEITVSDLPIDQTGILITSCVESGINSISSVNYTSSSYDESYNEALQIAIEAARSKAEAIAAAGNSKVGNMVHVEEHGYNEVPRTISYQNAALSATDSAKGMGVMPGQVDIKAQVTVEFEIISTQ